ncbi:hypothetical protein HYDPIDRAFT_174934 [Hydnomerulius pinastri MD-312]|nr:hypothetical protein HYDPIDRAFT_174934 [Hydnomerulius pinastri MD-312]
MASSRTSSSSSTKFPKASSAPNMKQGTLGFSSAKRTNSAVNAKTKKPAAVIRRSSSAVEKEKTKAVEDSNEVQSGAQDSGIVLEISSDEEYTPAETAIPAKRTRAGAKAKSSSSTTNQVASKIAKEPENDSVLAEVERKHLDAEDKAGRYRNYYNEVRAKMGYMEPIHSEGQNKIHQMLRFFDMSYEFGPCVGMTRLERWERAESFGLNPPLEVREILLTKEGIEKDEYAQCVLYGEV